MSELYAALGDTEYGQTLQDNIRFGSFKPQWLENWAWTEMLGPDVNNLEHMEHTAVLTGWYLLEAERLGYPFSDEDEAILMTTAYTHDFAEAIDGDISDPLKKHDDEAYDKERASFEAVASSVTDNPEELTTLVMSVTQGRHRLSRDFRAIEIIGYIETARQAGLLAENMGAIQKKYGLEIWQLRDLFNSFVNLHTEVMNKDPARLAEFGDLPVVRSYLDG